MSCKEAIRQRMKQLYDECTDDSDFIAPTELLMKSAQQMFCKNLLLGMIEDTLDGFIQSYEQARQQHNVSLWYDVVVDILVEAGHHDFAKTFKASCELSQ